MTLVNIQRLLDNTRSRTTVFTPVIEAIANSIHAIEDSEKREGEITVTLIRSTQPGIHFDSDATPDIVEIQIHDNGVGFNDKNLQSFSTIYSDFKLDRGGKGFGRFSFLKYFGEVYVESIYSKNDEYRKRSFNFVSDQEDIIANPTDEIAGEEKTGTTLYLRQLKPTHIGKIGKKVETISRHILENLLVLFVNDEYLCPRIIIRDSDTAITLNEYIENHKEIAVIADKAFVLTKGTEKQEFKVKVFKIYYLQSKNSIRLVAHNREVTDTPLYAHIPEFDDDFFDEIENDKKQKVKRNFAIKVYVTGFYLDDNVSLERNTFEFAKGNSIFETFSFSQTEIESRAAEIAKESFNADVKAREEKKVERINEYVNTEAPWHKPFLKYLDLSKVPFKSSPQEIEAELHRAKYLSEVDVKRRAEEILENDQEFTEKVSELSNAVTEIGKSDLAHYVALRKTVLDLFEKSLEVKNTGKYELEKMVHDIVFPTGEDSDSVEYQKHNLWLLDERLSFHEYVSSDKPMSKGAGSKRPDILIFNQRIAVRGGDEVSNPIVVFEFKRPQRTQYDKDEDPIKQIAGYIKKIRNGEIKNIKGRNIDASDRTPAYGFLVCDITPQIEEFCAHAQLKKTPDGKGYFGYHSTYEVYFEVISFDKMLRDAELRNKIFFKKLGI